MDRKAREDFVDVHVILTSQSRLNMRGKLFLYKGPQFLVNERIALQQNKNFKIFYKKWKCTLVDFLHQTLILSLQMGQAMLAWSSVLLKQGRQSTWSHGILRT